MSFSTRPTSRTPGGIDLRGPRLATAVTAALHAGRRPMLDPAVTPQVTRPVSPATRTTT